MLFHKPDQVSQVHPPTIVTARRSALPFTTWSNPHRFIHKINETKRPNNKNNPIQYIYTTSNLTAHPVSFFKFINKAEFFQNQKANHRPAWEIGSSLWNIIYWGQWHKNKKPKLKIQVIKSKTLTDKIFKEKPVHEWQSESWDGVQERHWRQWSERKCEGGVGQHQEEVIWGVDLGLNVWERRPFGQVVERSSVVLVWGD